MNKLQAISPVISLVPNRPGRRQQRGATLFTALMILILLTLLALSVAQVTSLQERMAGLYRADQQAFQSAEDQMRVQENSVLNISVCVAAENYKSTLPTGWREGTVSTGTRIENLTKSDPNGPLISAFVASGQANRDEQCQIGVFRVTSLQPDNPTDPTTRALVQSIFVP